MGTKATLAPLLLALAGCASPEAVPPPAPAAPLEAIGQSGFLPDVLDAEGRTYYLGNLLQDRILSDVVDGRAAERIDRVDWLLLVTSKPACEWTRRFLEETEAALPGFAALHVRTAAILDGEFGEHAAAWEAIRASGIPVFRDPSGATYRCYVQTGTPALTLMDRWGTVVFTLDGYLPPGDLVAKIRAGDFAAVKAAGG